MSWLNCTPFSAVSGHVELWCHIVGIRERCLRLGIEERLTVRCNFEFIIHQAIGTGRQLQALLWLKVLSGLAGLEIKDFDFVTHEELYDVAKNNLIALERIQDV